MPEECYCCCVSSLQLYGTWVTVTQRTCCAKECSPTSRSLIVFKCCSGINRKYFAGCVSTTLHAVSQPPLHKLKYELTRFSKLFDVVMKMERVWGEGPLDRNTGRHMPTAQADFVINISACRTVKVNCLQQMFYQECWVPDAAGGFAAERCSAVFLALKMWENYFLSEHCCWREKEMLNKWKYVSWISEVKKLFEWLKQRLIQSKKRGKKISPSGNPRPTPVTTWLDVPSLQLCPELYLHCTGAHCFETNFPERVVRRAL